MAFDEMVRKIHSTDEWIYRLPVLDHRNLCWPFVVDTEEWAKWLQHRCYSCCLWPTTVIEMLSIDVSAELNSPPESLPNIAPPVPTTTTLRRPLCWALFFLFLFTSACRCQREQLLKTWLSVLWPSPPPTLDIQHRLAVHQLPECIPPWTISSVICSHRAPAAILPPKVVTLLLAVL